MSNITEEEKNNIVQNILTLVDNVNIILQTPNYVKKYINDEDVMEFSENDNQNKIFLINSRERLRKILLMDWHTTKFNETQISDIISALSLVRQKINDVFTN
jgi:hypothetical protein